MTQIERYGKMCKKEQDYFRWVGTRKICLGLLFGQHIVDGMSYNVTSRSVAPVLKFQALAPAPSIKLFWLRLQHLEHFGSGSRTVWS